MSDVAIFIHNLSGNLAAIAKDQLDLAEINLSDEVVEHLGQSFTNVLKHLMEWRKEGH